MDINFDLIQSTLLDFAKSTPTPPNNPWIGEKTGITPPIGWTVAGLLMLLLVWMVYSEIRKFVRKLFKKKPR
jgi:hypothetical protein